MKQIVPRLVWLLVFALSSFHFCAALETHGFFSMEYLKGQEQSEWAEGSLQNLKGGLIFSGEMAPKLSFALELQFREVHRMEMEQAWVGFIPSDAFHLKIGLYLVPFGKYNQANRPVQTSLIKEPLPIHGAYPSSWRDLGLLLDGRIGFLRYAAYLGNGLQEGEDLRAGQQFKDNNRDKGKGVRIGLLLSQNFEAGYSYYSGKIDSNNERGLALQGLDGTWMTENFELTAEYVRARIENPEPFSQGKADGFFVLFRWILGNLQPLVGYEKWDYQDAVHGVGFTDSLTVGNGILEKKNGWIVGCVYSLSPNFLLKIEYDFNQESNLDLKNNVFQVQAAIAF
ncbi:MAG: porin [Candidatus Aminicenantales bacterium]